jgi:hypothetical protein
MLSAVTNEANRELSRKSVRSSAAHPSAASLPGDFAEMLD